MSTDADAAIRKSNKILYDRIMDYSIRSHKSPAEVADCIRKLIQLLGNVVDHPEDAHFRKIRASNKAFENHVVNVSGAIELLVEVGWRTKIVEFERSWVYEYQPGSAEWSVLIAVVEELRKALHTAEAKEKHYEQRLHDPHAEEREVRARVLAELEADRKERHERFVYSH